ncbi:hypothetical protein N7U49_22475 [Streptomyces sp. AD2-2]|nr:hypothetical protein N7U49_22475 [Streptomyces sp. AD2-2]
MNSSRYLCSRASRIIPIRASNGPNASFSAYPDGTSVASSVPKPAAVTREFDAIRSSR